MAIWNPWRRCHRKSEGCMNCYIHKGDAKRGVDTSLIRKTDKFDVPIARKKNGKYKIGSGSMKNVPRNPADSSVGGIGTVPFLCIDCVCIVLQFLCSYCLRFLHDICIFMCISDTVFELVYLIKYGYENNEATHISHRSMCPSISIQQAETDYP